jgi:hypothetical protein
VILIVNNIVSELHCIGLAWEVMMTMMRPSALAMVMIEIDLNSSKSVSNCEFRIISLQNRNAVLKVRCD